MQCLRSLSELFRNFDNPAHEMARPIVQDYEAIQLSQAITDRKQLRLVFLDGDTLGRDSPLAHSSLDRSA